MHVPLALYGKVINSDEIDTCELDGPRVFNMLIILHTLRIREWEEKHCAVYSGPFFFFFYLSLHKLKHAVNQLT